MSPRQTLVARRLVLARETVRSLTERPHPALTLAPQDVTSCGQECGCTGRIQPY